MNTIHLEKIEYSEEAFTTELISKVASMIVEHHHEVSSFKSLKIKPSFDLYSSLYENGFLKIYCIKYEGEIVGYNVFFVRKHHHFDMMHAVQDLIYLQKRFRGRLIGYRFIKWCDERLKELGVDVVYSHVNSEHNFGRMLERQGYQLIDYVYAKRLNA